MRRRMILFGVLATLALTALSATSVAGATHRPDGWVRFEGFDGVHLTSGVGAWKGKDVYNTTALNQTATEKFSGAYFHGDYWYFTVTIQNDGTTDHFKVKGGGDNLQAKYFKGSTNITSQVKAGTYQTATLAAGAQTTITVRLYIEWDQSALVTITSVADPTKKDVVKAVIKHTACGC